MDGLRGQLIWEGLQKFGNNDVRHGLRPAVPFVLKVGVIEVLVRFKCGCCLGEVLSDPPKEGRGGLKGDVRELVRPG